MVNHNKGDAVHTENIVLGQKNRFPAPRKSGFQRVIGKEPFNHGRRADEIIATLLIPQEASIVSGEDENRREYVKFAKKPDENAQSVNFRLYGDLRMIREHLRNRPVTVQIMLGKRSVSAKRSFIEVHAFVVDPNRSLTHKLQLVSMPRKARDARTYFTGAMGTTRVKLTRLR